MPIRADDEFWMLEAIHEAESCLRDSPNSSRNDVPIGAICVFEGKVVGRGHNRREIDGNPVAHAEVLALQSAAETLQRHQLDEVTLYVTLEPCPMCAGALWLSRVKRLVFGAWDAKAGACGSVFDLVRDPRLNHQLEMQGGVLEQECLELLQSFFSSLRKK